MPCETILSIWSFCSFTSWFASCEMTSYPFSANSLRINVSSFFQRSVAKSEKERPILVFPAAAGAAPQPASTIDAITISEKMLINMRCDFILILLFGWLVRFTSFLRKQNFCLFGTRTSLLKYSQVRYETRRSSADHQLTQNVIQDDGNGT